MINLLPEETKNDIRAARSNVYIANYTLIIVLAFVLIGIAFYSSYLFMEVTEENAKTVIESNDTKAGVYSQTKQDVDTLNSQLSGAKSILDQEIRYSQVLTKIGAALPTGTVISNLDVSNSNFQGTPVDIVIYAKSAESAAVIQSQFMNSGVFTSVTIKSTESNQDIKNYPFTITLTTVFNKVAAKL